MPQMGIREYARHRGVSHVAVIKAVRAGRIQREVDGRIDSGAADLAWERNTHPVSRVATGAEAGGGFTRARTVREHYRARLAQLTYEERCRELVDAAEVQAAAREVSAACRQHLLGIPDRVAAEIAGVDDPQSVYRILSSVIRQALEEFADRRLVGVSPCFPAPTE